MRHLQALGEPPINDNQPYVFNEAELKKAVDEFVRVFNETSSGESEKVGIAFDTMMNKAGLAQINDKNLTDELPPDFSIDDFKESDKCVAEELRKAFPGMLEKEAKYIEKKIESMPIQEKEKLRKFGAVYALHRQFWIDEKKSQGMSTAKKIMIFGGGALAIGGIIYYLNKRLSK